MPASAGQLSSRPLGVAHKAKRVRGSHVMIVSRAAILGLLATALVSCLPHRAGSTQTPLLPTPILAPEPTIGASPLPTDASPAIPSSPAPSSMPVSTAPTILVVENGLTWMECVIPNRDYYHTVVDIPVITDCLGMNLPSWDENDEAMAGERIPHPTGDTLRLVIGSDVYETRYNPTRTLDLLKNGSVIATANANFDAHESLNSIGGLPVWEIADYWTIGGDSPDIFVEGVSLNEKYQLDGAFFPYQLKGRLIFIARQDGAFRIIYDGEAFGRRFDTISMAYCCARISVMGGQGRYMFLGESEGTMFAVVIQ